MTSKTRQRNRETVKGSIAPMNTTRQSSTLGISTTALVNLRIVAQLCNLNASPGIQDWLDGAQRCLHPFSAPICI